MPKKGEKKKQTVVIENLWLRHGNGKFGDNKNKWEFICPVCNEILSHSAYSDCFEGETNKDTQNFIARRNICLKCGTVAKKENATYQVKTRTSNFYAFDFYEPQKIS